MFISKFWITLITLAATVMLAVIILAKDAVNRERIENATAILYKEISKADVAMKLHARKRLDVLLKVSADPEVRKILAMASVKPGDMQAYRDKLLGPLRKLNNSLEDYKADLLIAVDRKGKVVCQTGDKEREAGYGLAGLPVVTAALRGYVRDDIIKLDKEVFLIAARPVIHEGRYVGATIHAMKFSDKLVTDISPAIQFSIFSGNMMLAVGTPKIEGQPNVPGALIAEPLGEVLTSEQFKKRGYSDVRRLSGTETPAMAVYAKVKGEAAVHEVGYAVVVPLDLMDATSDVYQKASKQDIEELPIVRLVLVFILLTAVGWLFTYLEGQRPVSKLLAAVEGLTKSDPKDQLNVYHFRRKIRKIALAINKVVDYKLKSLIEDSEGGSVKSIDAILGHQEDARLSSASFKFIEPSADDIPPPPPDEPKTSKETIPEPPKKKAPPIGNRSPSPPTSDKPPIPKKKTSVPPSPQEEGVYFKSIYEQFVALKKQLNEPVDQLTFERFQVTLRKNRDTLKARYNCASVKFQVYEKDGKASLKATPVKD